MANPFDEGPATDPDASPGVPEQPASAADSPAREHQTLREGLPPHAAEVEDLAERLHRGGHVVICNWNSKGEAVIQELHSEVVRDQRLLVIVTDKQLPKRIGNAWRGVFTVHGNPLEEEYLEQAMVTKAHSAIILADEQSPNPDTANFMIAACIERINPDVHTIIEITQSAYLKHFQGTGVDDMICLNEIAEKIISQACLTPGLSALYLHLLTASKDTNEIYMLPAPESTHGQTYRAIRRAIGAFDGESMVLLGLLTRIDEMQAPDHWKTCRRNGKRMAMVVNPPQNPKADNPFSQSYVIRPGDELIIMAYEEPDLRRLAVGGPPKT